MTSRSDLRGALRAYRLWRTHPDVVLTQSIDAHVIGHGVALRARVPHVAAEHGGAGIHRGTHRTLAARLVAPRVARAIAVSRSQLPDLEELGYRGERIRVIPNGLPPLRPARDRSEVRRELGLADDDVAAVLVAVLRPEKRADRFVDGVARAHSLDPRVRGIVVGGGPLLDEIRARAQAADSGVTVLGQRTDVPELIAAADVVCVTSDVEGLPMSALEAMALARPIVATDVGGLREVVMPGRTGALISTADATALSEELLRLAADPARRTAMGEEALRRFNDTYSVERMVDAYVKLFSELVEGAVRQA
jgi:glycosyltransferase involved in cell wall biosynthesis